MVARPKEILAPRLLAVDPSLTCSGWALFLIEGERLAAVGKIRALPPGIPMARRLKDLQAKVSQCLEELCLGEGDFLVCEAPTTMRDPRAALLVEQVRGVFETLGRARAVEVPGRVNPRTVHREVMGLKGPQLPRLAVKGIAQHMVDALYRSDLKKMGFPIEGGALAKHQDVFDAILLGNVALTRLRSARGAGMDADEVFDALIKKTPRLRVRG